MFREEVYNESLVGNAGRIMMPNFNCGDWYSPHDNSFQITLFSLLFPRFKEDDSLNLYSTSFNAERHLVNKTDSEVVQIFKAYTSFRPNDCDQLTVIDVTGYSEPSNRVINVLAESFCDENLRGYKPLNDLRAFFAPHFNAAFFINEELRNTIVIVREQSITQYHLLQTVTSRLLPWFFVDNPLTDEERAFVGALSQPDGYNTYKKYVDDLIERIDVRSIEIKNMLDGFEKRVLRGQLARTERGIENCLDEMNSLLQRYRNCNVDRERLITTMAGLKHRIENDDIGTELVDYFIHNKSLIPLSSSSDALSFIVTTYLDSFDPDAYETVSRNRRTAYLNTRSSFDELNNSDDRLMLLDAIFSDEPVIRIKVMAYFKVDVYGGVTSCRHYDFARELWQNHIPNPHLYYHNCLGQNAPAIAEALASGDFVAAIGQCVAATANFNVQESPTAEPFLRDFLSTQAKCLEFSDGTLCSPTEALLKLKEQQNNTREEENNG